MPELSRTPDIGRGRRGAPPRRVVVAGVECWERATVTCSACGQKVQIGAPSEDCCPARYDKPAPQWVRDFHAEHGVWPVRFAR